MKQTLLIADGDAQLREYYDMLLTESGYEVETASNGLDCLRKLRRATPAALLLDLDLRWGGSDGILDWLREEGSAYGIPVILTAMAANFHEFANLIEPPVVGCLPKPFAAGALLESVRTAIARNERREPSSPNFVAAASEVFVG